MIAGRGLAVDNSIGAELRTGELDGVEMIAQLAEGKIEFPLRGSLVNTSETSAAGSPEYSLADYSLQELCSGLSFALQENIKKIEERINTLRTTKEQRVNHQQTLHYLERYQESLTMGGEILLSLTDQIEEGGEGEAEIIFERIKLLHECFSAHAQALKEISKDVTLGDSDRARYLSHQARALIYLTAELSRKQPRGPIAAGYNRAFAFYSEALAIIDTSQCKYFDTRRYWYGENDFANCARFLDNKATALFKSTEEAAGANRANIVAGYNEVIDLCDQAVAALANYEGDLFVYYNLQAAALFKSTEEEAGANRARIVAGYNEAFDLYGQSLVLIPGSIRHLSDYLSEHMAKEAHAHFELAEEEAEANRTPIIDGYKKLIDLQRRCIAAIRAENRVEYDHLKEQANSTFNRVRFLEEEFEINDKNYVERDRRKVFPYLT